MYNKITIEKRTQIIDGRQFCEILLLNKDRYLHSLIKNVITPPVKKLRVKIFQTFIFKKITIQIFQDIIRYKGVRLCSFYITSHNTWIWGSLGGSIKN